MVSHQATTPVGTGLQAPGSCRRCARCWRNTAISWSWCRSWRGSTARWRAILRRPIRRSRCHPSPPHWPRTSTSVDSCQLMETVLEPLKWSYGFNYWCWGNYWLFFCFFRSVLSVLVVDGRSICCRLCELFDWNWGSCACFDILYFYATRCSGDEQLWPHFNHLFYIEFLDYFRIYWILPQENVYIAFTPM